MEDDLKKNKKMKTTKKKMENDLNKNGKRTNQPKINLIGCDTIVNSPSIGFFHLRNCQVFRSQTNFVRQILELVLTKNSDSTLHCCLTVILLYLNLKFHNL